MRGTTLLLANSSSWASRPPEVARESAPAHRTTNAARYDSPRRSRELYPGRARYHRRRAGRGPDLRFEARTPHPGHDLRVALVSVKRAEPGMTWDQHSHGSSLTIPRGRRVVGPAPAVILGASAPP